MSGLDALNKKKKVRHFDDGGWTSGWDAPSSSTAEGYTTTPYVHNGGGNAPSGPLNIASPDFNPQAYIEAGGGTWNPSGGATAADISGLYESVLGRAPDPEGLAYWTQQAGSGASLQAIEQAFRSSPEFASRAGGVLTGPQIINTGDVMGGGGFTTSGVPYQNIASAIGNTLSDTNLSAKEQADRIYNVSQQFGVTPDDIALSLGIPVTQVQDYFQNRVDYPITEAYQSYLGRTPDLEGLQFWRTEMEKGRSAEQIAADIARSEEARGLRAGELAGLFTKQFEGTDFVNQLTKDEMNRFTDIFSDITAKQTPTDIVGQDKFDANFYLQQNPDVARSQVYGSDPYQHYLDYGFREGRAPNVGEAMTAQDRYFAVLKEAALDPELGAAMKAKDPMLYYSLTPLERDPNQAKTTERVRYGDYGLVNVGGKDIPILNANVIDSFFGNANSGTMQDFSHDRGNYTRDLGWTSNSASNMIAKGADALGVTKYTSEYGNGYTGLEEAAKLMGIDPNQFQDKQVQAVTQPGFNESGGVVFGGEPMFQTDEFGNRTPVMQTITAQDQLYDAVGAAAKDIYRVTMDSLDPGKAVEGGAQSFNTVFYQKAGDKLVPISAPQEHGGMQNAAVYQPKDFGFGYYAQGPMIVGSAALAWTGVGAGLATTIGSTLGFGTGAIGTAVGGVVIGSATGALGAAVTGGNIEKGAIAGGIAGGLSATMPQILNNIPGMESLVTGISDSLGVAAKDVSTVIGSTLSRTLATATAGANGEQILNAFGTALASSTLGAAASNAVTNVMAENFTPEQIAGMARATQLVTNAAATSFLTGGSDQQIIGSVINSLVQGAGSIKAAADAASVDQATTPFGTENVGFTTGAVDAVLQEPIFRQDILDNASDPIAAMNAMNNWTGNQQENMQYLAGDLISQGMPRQDIINSFQSVFRMDEPSAKAFVEQEVARSAIIDMANKSEDPIATFNAATMATGDKKANVDLVVKEMINQGQSKAQISQNLQDIFRVPAEKADAYATQITKDQPFTTKATTFGEAFREAREAGVKEFEYDGKRFNTNLAPTKVEQIDRKEAETGAIPKDEGRAPSWSGLIKSTAPVPGLKSAVDQPMETTPFGPMATSRAPSFMGQAGEIATRAATQQQINNYLGQGNPPVPIDPNDKTVVQSIADFYKESLLGTAGQYIESLGNLRTYLSQVGVAHGFISPDNSFVVSSKAMQQVGDAIIPPALKQEQSNIVRSIDKADGIGNKIVSGIVSAIENPRGASLFVGGALVEAGFALGVGSAATAFTGLTKVGIATSSLIQGAQSFGSRYQQLVEAGVDPDKAMLPSYVSGVITTLTSAVANTPIIKAITSPATSKGTDIVLRNITGEGAEKIIQVSIPVFVAAGMTRDFATEFLDEMLGGMSTEYILEGTITPSRYETEAVLAGLIDIGANAAVRLPFELADRIGAQTGVDTTRQAPDMELKEYTVPLLEYQPATAPAQIGYSPTISPEGAVDSVIETRDNSARQLFDNLDIDPDTAIKASTAGIGAATIEAMNAESSNKSTQIDPKQVIIEDAFGNPITYADALGAIITESPIIDLQVGTKEQQISNVEILQSLFDKLNIDPSNAMVQVQQQLDVLPRETELAFKERPDVRDLFNVETLFPEDVTQPVTDIQLTNQVDTNLANDLATKLETNTVTATDLALANDLLVKLETQVQQATDPAIQQQLQTDIQVVTDLISKINTAVQVPTDVAQTPVDVQPDVNVNVPIDVSVQPETEKEKKKKEERRRRPAYQRALQLIDLDSGIYDLGPAFTRARTNYRLAGQFGMASGGRVALPFYDKIAPRYDVFGMARDSNTGAQGILGGGAIFDPKSPFVGSDIKMPKLTVGTTKKNLNYELAGYPDLGKTALQYAEGGSIPEGHNPQFFSEGGLNSLENTYVNGEGDGTSDSVPAMLANGEFVIPADVVSSLGNGSNEAGAGVLDEFLRVVREHKQKHDAKKLPPDSKGALAYLLEAKKRA